MVVSWYEYPKGYLLVVSWISVGLCSLSSLLTHIIKPILVFKTRLLKQSNLNIEHTFYIQIYLFTYKHHVFMTYSNWHKLELSTLMSIKQK